MSNIFVCGTDPICEEIANVLGFSAVTSLRIDLPSVKAMLTVTVTKLVTLDEAQDLVEVLSRYKIEATPIEAKPE